MEGACSYSEGVLDESGRLVMEKEAVGPAGALVTERSLLSFPDADSIVMRVTHVAADGTERPFMDLAYTRRK